MTIRDYMREVFSDTQKYIDFIEKKGKVQKLVPVYETEDGVILRLWSGFDKDRELFFFIECDPMNTMYREPNEMNTEGFTWRGEEDFRKAPERFYKKDIDKQYTKKDEWYSDMARYIDSTVANMYVIDGCGKREDLKLEDTLRNAPGPFKRDYKNKSLQSTNSDIK